MTLAIKRIDRKVLRSGKGQIDRFEIGNYTVRISTSIEETGNYIDGIEFKNNIKDIPTITTEDLSDECNGEWVENFQFKIGTLADSGNVTIEQMQEMIQKYQDALEVIEIVKNEFLN